MGCSRRGPGRVRKRRRRRAVESSESVRRLFGEMLRRRERNWPEAKSRWRRHLHVTMLLLSLASSHLATATASATVERADDQLWALDGNEPRRDIKPETTSSFAAPLAKSLGAAADDVEGVTGAGRQRRYATMEPPGAQVLRAPLKGRVLLACPLEPPEPDDAVSLVLWYKDKSPVPIYSVDARSTPVQEARHKPGPWLEGRSQLRFLEAAGSEQAQLAARRKRQVIEERPRWHQRKRLRAHHTHTTPSVGPAVSLVAKTPNQLVAQLVIESLSSEDNGLYLCRVDFRRARSRLHETQLRIIVPADKPTIRDLGGAPASPQDDDKGQLVVGPYLEGSRLVLECETQGGHPEPELTWWRDGRLVDDSYELVSALDGSLLSGRGERLSPESPTLDQYLSRLEEADEQQQQPPPQAQVADVDEAAAQPAPTTKSPNQKQLAKLLRNRLELGPLTRADLLANYSCQAWNSRLATGPSSSALIDMNLAPLKVEIENERAPVLAGRPLELACRAQGSRPPAKLSWWRDGRPLAGEPLERPTEAANSSSSGWSGLVVRPQPEDAGRSVVCRAENPLAQQQQQQQPPSQLEDAWRLDVQHLPRVRIALGDKLQAPIREGQDVYFECHVQAQPPATETRWWLDGRELETNTTGGVIISNQSLVLQRVGRHQRGRYTCSAANQLGEQHSAPLQLRVQFAPVCRRPAHPNQEEAEPPARPPKTLYGAARLETVQVSCQVEADPADQLRFRWAFVAADAANLSAASALQLPQADGLAQSEPGVASYTPRGEQDYGTLLCWAENQLGEQREPCAYRLVPAEPPEPPRNCRLAAATDNQLQVACEPGYDGGNDQTIRMEVYEAPGRQLVANVTSSVAPEAPAPSQSASLVSSQLDSASHHRQRHSDPNGAGGHQHQHQQHQQQHQQVLVTEAKLKPATDYFLSIYSTNSKGSSRPVAFTAATSSGPNSANEEQARRTEAQSTTLMSDVMSGLSWGPFLAVLLLTLLLFVMFATITFAMMKYVDFGSLSFPSQPPPSNPNGANDRQTREARANFRSNTSKASEDENDEDDDESSETRQRAGVLGAGLSNSPMRLLSGAYLKFRLQQLTGTSSMVQAKPTLRTSTSEHLLDQLAAASGFEVLQAPQTQTQARSHTLAPRRQQQVMAADQAATGTCGTLPRNAHSLLLRPPPTPPTPGHFESSFCGASGHAHAPANCEHLVIGAKHYIQQRQQQQPRLPASPHHLAQRHLQLTGALGPIPCGPEANLYATNQQLVCMGSDTHVIDGAYLLQAEFEQQQQQQQPAQPGEPDACGQVGEHRKLAQGAEYLAPPDLNNNSGLLLLMGANQVEPGAGQLDSDGMSSAGTQRSRTTTAESPSSGLQELDHQHHLQGVQQPQVASYVGQQQQQQQPGSTSTLGSSTGDGSHSVVAVDGQPTTGDIRILSTSSALRSRTGNFKPSRKSLHQQHLTAGGEQYTFYLEEDNSSSSYQPADGTFYVLEQEQEQAAGGKGARVRLVSGAHEQYQHQHQHQSMLVANQETCYEPTRFLHHQHHLTYSRSPHMASTTSTSNTSTSASNDLLHTDV